MRIYTNKINKKKYFGVRKNIQKYRDIILNTFSEEEIIKIVKKYAGLESKFDLKNMLLELLKAEALVEIMNVIEDSFEKGGRRVLNTKGKTIKLGKVINKTALSFLRQRQLNYLSNIADVIAEKITNILQQGFEEGKGIREITKSIKEEAKNITKNRAELIARSEIIKASAMGTKQSMREAGIKKYMWISAQDNKVCPICKKLNGRKFDVSDENSPIPVQDTHPNCRCSLVMAD